GAAIVLPMLAFAAPKDTQSEATRQLRAFLAADWRLWMTEYPEVATHVGVPGHDDRWTDDSLSGIERRKEHLINSLTRLKAVHRSELPSAEQLNFDLYLELLETANEGLQYGDD